MSTFIVDVESDGPCPGLYSMIAFGCVKLGESHGFHATIRPISHNYIPEALAISGYTREECYAFDSPESVMKKFCDWVYNKNSEGRPVFVSDNPAFDWQFINYYFWLTIDKNPFGFSARRIGDFAAGLKGNWAAQNSWKQLRVTKHTHNPLDDALGNAEALTALMEKL
jgi:hypothetical protein